MCCSLFHCYQCSNTDVVAVTVVVFVRDCRAIRTRRTTRIRASVPSASCWRPIKGGPCWNSRSWWPSSSCCTGTARSKPCGSASAPDRRWWPTTRTAPSTMTCARKWPSTGSPENRFGFLFYFSNCCIYSFSLYLVRFFIQSSWQFITSVILEPIFITESSLLRHLTLYSSSLLYLILCFLDFY